jgi:hypothetical protein
MDVNCYATAVSLVVGSASLVRVQGKCQAFMRLGERKGRMGHRVRLRYLVYMCGSITMELLCTTNIY